MFPADNSAFYNDYYAPHNDMDPTTSSSAQPRLSLDSGFGSTTNDSFYSSDLNESHQMDVSAVSTSETSYSFQSGPLESSPPTKWARIRTPPNRKKTLPQDVKAVPPPAFNLLSPPSRKKIKTMFTSPTSNMKTPESLRKSIRISSPSPFKVTFSKTPLKLSNNENVTGIHIGRSGTYYNKTVTGSSSKKCLLPSKPDGFTFLGSPNSDTLDAPLQTEFEGFEDILKDTSDNVNLLEDDFMDYHRYAGMIETERGSEPSPEANFENNNGKSTRTIPISRSASRNLLKNASDSDFVVPVVENDKNDPWSLIAPPKPQKSARKQLPFKSKQQSAKEAMLREAKEKEMKVWKSAPFETPKKEIPLFSGRWLVISTGRTLAQQELFSDATSFLRKHPPSKTLPTVTSSNRRIPTIARVTLFKHRYRSLRC